jgi:hypothetical protein
MNNELTKSLLAIGFAVSLTACAMVAIGFVIVQGTRYQAPAQQQTEAQADSTPQAQADSATKVNVFGPTLLAGSFCVSMPTDVFSISDNHGAKFHDDFKITLLTFSREEERRFANNEATVRDFAKAAAEDLAKKDGYVAFIVDPGQSSMEGIDRYFATSPLNIVNK